MHHGTHFHVNKIIQWLYAFEVLSELPSVDIYFVCFLSWSMIQALVPFLCLSYITILKIHTLIFLHESEAFVWN